MGNLVAKSDLNALWMFKDAYINHYNGKGHVSYIWPSPQYPHTVAIHETDMPGPLRVSIYEWVEDTLTETVIYDFHDKSYRTVAKSVDLWDQFDRSWQRSNVWTRFYFRKEESLLAFVLKFGEFIKPITDYSPEYGPVSESDIILT